MFGYIIINKGEMKFKEFDVYHSYYCGLCRSLKKRYGISGQISLTYDMTFLALLLTSLYEPSTKESYERCIVHPLEKHRCFTNSYIDYAADMNVLFSYYKCKDDWNDEKKVSKLAYSKLLENAFKKISSKYPDKVKKIDQLMKRIGEGEKIANMDIDYMSNLFGEIMGEVMTPKKDEWHDELISMGIFLGKFIYLLDAYEDIEADIKNSRYNPFISKYSFPDFDEECKTILTMMMASCCSEFEKLPILENTEILRNILYSGVWYRFEKTYKERCSVNNEKS